MRHLQSSGLHIQVRAHTHTQTRIKEHKDTMATRKKKLTRKHPPSFLGDRGGEGAVNTTSPF